MSGSCVGEYIFRCCSWIFVSLFVNFELFICGGYYVICWIVVFNLFMFRFIVIWFWNYMKDGILLFVYKVILCVVMIFFMCLSIFVCCCVFSFFLIVVLLFFNLLLLIISWFIVLIIFIFFIGRWFFFVCFLKNCECRLFVKVVSFCVWSWLKIL